MAFLEKLRMANIFPRNQGQSPLGMPNTSQSDPFLREAIPLAHSLELEREARATNRIPQDMNYRTSAPPVNRIKQIGESLGINKPENVVYGGDLGVTPTQQRFQQQGDIQQGIDLEDKKFKRGVAREDDLASVKRKEDESAFNKKLMTSRVEQDLARELEDTKFKRYQETSKTEFDRRKQLADEADRADRERAIEVERARGEEARKTWEVRPNNSGNITPSQQTHDFKNQVQRLQIDEPEAAKLIEHDPTTDTYTISRRATPEQKAWIQNYLTGRNSNQNPNQNQPQNPNQVQPPRQMSEQEFADLNARADAIIKQFGGGGR